jgi:hypothetical protein
MSAGRFAALIAVVAIGATSSPSQAIGSEACSEEQRAWAAECARTSGIAIDAARCPSGRLIVSSPVPLEVEIRRGDQGLRVSAGFGLSPVGEFADWSAEPASRRAAFDAIAACAAAAAVPISDDDGDSGDASHYAAASGAQLPWLFLLSLIGLGVLLGSGRPRPRRAAELAGLGVVAFGIQFVLVPFAFFHQNGQGAMWIEYALRGHGGLDAYGPGYRELFSAVATAFPSNPDMAVFIAQGLLGAMLPPLVWIIARRAGAQPVVCWSIAGVVAIDPTLIRVAHSESYFGCMVVLCALAVAAAMEGAHRANLRDWRAWLGFATAGLIVAQAARVHPSVWFPAALLPLAVFAVPATTVRDRGARALACAAVVAVLVTTTSAGVMIDVLRSDVVPGDLAGRLAVPPIGVLAVFVAAIACAAWQLERSVVGLYAVVAGAIVTGTMLASNPLPYDYPAYQQAIFRLHVPVLAALAAGVAVQVDLRASRSPRALTAVVVAIAIVGVGHAIVRWSELTLRATDVEESRWVRTWRDDLPARARVVYLARAGERTYALPIYPVEGGLVPIAMDVAQADTIALAPGSFYYRSSLCATPEGEAACSTVESRYRLSSIDERTLEPVPSQPWAPVDRPVVVGIFRVDDP